jgi:hypothetical protein
MWRLAWKFANGTVRIQWDSTHTCFHDKTTSFLGGTIESLTDLDDIRLPTENLLNSFISHEDSNHVTVLGRIGIGRHSAKVKGDRVGLVKLELLHVFVEGEKNLVLVQYPGFHPFVACPKRIQVT